MPISPRVCQCDVIQMIDPVETTHKYTYDAQGRELSDTALPSGGSAVNFSVNELTFNYNVQGLPYQQTSLNGSTVVNQVQDEYNGLGQLVQQYQAVSGAVNTSSTPSVQYQYGSAYDGSVPAGITYPNGRQDNYVYYGGLDANIGRLMRIQDLSSGTAATVVTYSYQGLNTVVGETLPQPASANLVMSETLDSFGRVSEWQWKLAGHAGAMQATEYSYNNFGEVTVQNDLTLPQMSTVTTYDPLGRVIASSQGTLNQAGTGLANPGAAEYQYTYNGLNALTGIVNNAKDSPALTYDGAGDLSGSSDADGDSHGAGHEPARRDDRGGVRRLGPAGAGDGGGGRLCARVRHLRV